MRKKLLFSPLNAYLVTVGAWFFAFGLQSIIFPALVIFELKENSHILGIAQASLAAPMLFLLIPAGWMADRINMRKTLWRLYLLACLPTLVLILIFTLQILTLPFLYLYAIIIGTISALTLPSRDAALNSILSYHQKSQPLDKTLKSTERKPKITLQKAVIIAQFTQFSFQIAGMLTAIYARVSWILSLQLCAFLFAAVSAYKMPNLKPVPEIKKKEKLFTEILTDPVLPGLICMMFAVGIFAIGAGFLVIIPIMVRDVFQGSYFLLSTTTSMFWFGAFVSVAALMAYKNIKRPGRLLLICQILGVLAYASLARAHNLIPFLMIIAAWGITGGVVTAMGRFILQHRIPKDRLGRVMALYQLGFIGGAPIGAIIFGYVLHFFGLFATILIASSGYALTILFLLLITPLWSLE